MITLFSIIVCLIAFMIFIIMMLLTAYFIVCFCDERRLGERVADTVEEAARSKARKWKKVMR